MMRLRYTSSKLYRFQPNSYTITNLLAYERNDKNAFAKKKH